MLVLILISLHKIVNNLVDINSEEYLQPANSIIRGHPLQFNNVYEAMYNSINCA